jgi:phosphoglycolate phosphatase
MRLRTVLFDLDGTLVDQFQAIYRCHAFAMRQIGLPEPTFEQVKRAIGRGLDDAIRDLAGDQNVARILPIYQEHWNATGLHDAALFPGSRELLQALRDRGVKCAAFTNKRGRASREVCAHLGLAPLLDGNFGAGETALVGDSIYDVAAALNADLAFFGVTTGTHDAAALRAAGAREIFPDLAATTPAILARC